MIHLPLSLHNIVFLFPTPPNGKIPADELIQLSGVNLKTTYSFFELEKLKNSKRSLESIDGFVFFSNLSFSNMFSFLEKSKGKILQNKYQKL